MGKEEMVQIADLIDRVLSSESVDQDGITQDVKDICDRFPIYEDLLKDVMGSSS